VGVVCDMPEVYKIPMVRMEEKLTNTAKNWRILECTGLYRDVVERSCDTISVVTCGWVKIVHMKVHTMLQALVK